MKIYLSLSGDAMQDVAYIHIIIQLYPPRAIKINLLERPSDHVVRLPLGPLCSLNHSSFVNVALVFHVELAESIL